MGYAKSFLCNRGDILRGGMQNFSYIVGETQWRSVGTLYKCKYAKSLLYIRRDFIRRNLSYISPFVLIPHHLHLPLVF